MKIQFQVDYETHFQHYESKVLWIKFNISSYVNGAYKLNEVEINAQLSLLTDALRMQMPGFMRRRRPLMIVTVAVKLKLVF